jgi:hypothetical protein
MTTDTPSPLSAEQQEDLHAAKARAASFMGAAKVAAFNGWTIAFFAVVSILFGLTSLKGLAVGIGLAVVARNELVGRRRIRELDASGLELLWRNQVGLMLLIIAYCVWSMYQASGAPDPEMAQLTEMLGGGTGALVRTLTLTLYGVVIVATAIFQGLNAHYYFVRVARLREYVRLTPAWVLDVQRSAVIE